MREGRPGGGKEEESVCRKQHQKKAKEEGSGLYGDPSMQCGQIAGILLIGIRHIDLAKLLILWSVNLSVKEPINIPLVMTKATVCKRQHKTRKKKRKSLSVEMREITVDAVVAAVLLDLHTFFFYIERGTKNGCEGFQCHSRV